MAEHVSTWAPDENNGCYGFWYCEIWGCTCAEVKDGSDREADGSSGGGDNLNLGGTSARTRTFSIIFMEVQYIEGKIFFSARNYLNI